MAREREEENGADEAQQRRRRALPGGAAMGTDSPVAAKPATAGGVHATGHLAWPNPRPLRRLEPGLGTPRLSTARGGGRDARRSLARTGQQRAGAAAWRRRGVRDEMGFFFLRTMLHSSRALCGTAGGSRGRRLLPSAIRRPSIFRKRQKKMTCLHRFSTTHVLCPGIPTTPSIRKYLSEKWMYLNVF